MAEVQKDGNGWTAVMRWTARLLTLVATALFVFFAVEAGSRVFPSLSWGAQEIPLFIALLVALAGALVAWRWELVGGAMTLAGVAVIMALVCIGSGIDMFYCAFLFTLPLLIAGILHLGCCYRKRAVKAT